MYVSEQLVKEFPEKVFVYSKDILLSFFIFFQASVVVFFYQIIYTFMYVFFPILFYSGSKQNEHKRTYDGVDVMGERLTNEVCNTLKILVNVYDI
jgi:hypothetical protein